MILEGKSQLWLTEFIFDFTATWQISLSPVTFRLFKHSRSPWDTAHILLGSSTEGIIAPQKNSKHISELVSKWQKYWNVNQGVSLEWKEDVSVSTPFKIERFELLMIMNTSWQLYTPRHNNIMGVML